MLPKEPEPLRNTRIKEYGDDAFYISIGWYFLGIASALLYIVCILD